MRIGFKIFFPDYRFKKITDIKSDVLPKDSLLIFDIDNTLFFPETTQTKKEIVDWFSEIKNRYQCICLSNSDTIRKRKDEIEKTLNCRLFISNRKKPSRKLFSEIKKEFPSVKNFVVIGDRVFPDVLFGKLNDAETVLVGILSKKEKPIIRVVRIIEKIFIYPFIPFNE